MVTRTLVATVGTVGVGVMAALPADASANLTAVDIATGAVSATCSIAPAVLLGPHGGLELTVDGSAVSGSPAQTLATNISCVVKTNFGSFGGPSLGLPGPASATAGMSNEIPLDKTAGLRVCAYGTSFVQGGSTIGSTPSTGC